MTTAMQTGLPTPTTPPLYSNKGTFSLAQYIASDLTNMPDSLQIALKNDSDSENIHAYVVSVNYRSTIIYQLTNSVNRQELPSSTMASDVSSKLTARTCTFPPKSKTLVLHY
jgi:hypothetical protein